MNCHLVTTVSVGCDTKVPSAVFTTGAKKSKSADDAISGVVLLKSVTIIGKFRI